MEIRQSTVRDVTAGQNVIIYEPANIYGCILRDNVFVGPFVEIQKNCEIGSDTRIQSHTFICENVRIGQGCFIGHGVTFVNDLFKSGVPDPEPSHWLSVDIGDNVTIGSSATILTHTICAGSLIGAGSVVVKPIHIKGIYAGNPAKLIREL